MKKEFDFKKILLRQGSHIFLDMVKVESLIKELHKNYKGHLKDKMEEIRK